MTKSKMLPFLPEEKSNQASFWSLTKKDGVFSLLNGDRPFQLAARALQFHAAADDFRNRKPGFQFIEELGREAHGVFRRVSRGVWVLGLAESVPIIGRELRVFRAERPRTKGAEIGLFPGYSQAQIAGRGVLAQYSPRHLCPRAQMPFFTVIPLWLSAFLIVGLPTALAMFGPVVVRRFVQLDKLRTNNEVAGFKFATVGVIYAVLLAFAVIVVWEKFNDAELNVAREASAAATIFRLADSFVARPRRAAQGGDDRLSARGRRQGLAGDGRRTRQPRRDARAQRHLFCVAAKAAG